MNRRVKHDTPAHIEDYALLGDMRTAALVDRNGSVDWMCLPRFDTPACFSALLGTADHGHWLLRPQGESNRIERRYRDGTLILETTHHAEGGAVRSSRPRPDGPADERPSRQGRTPHSRLRCVAGDAARGRRRNRRDALRQRC